MKKSIFAVSCIMAALLTFGCASNKKDNKTTTKAKCFAVKHSQKGIVRFSVSAPLSPCFIVHALLLLNFFQNFFNY